MDEFFISDNEPDYLDGFDEALCGTTFVAESEGSNRLHTVALYDGNMLASIAVEQESIDWDDAVDWASTVKFTCGFRIEVSWPMFLIEDEDTPTPKPDLKLVH